MQNIVCRIEWMKTIHIFLWINSANDSMLIDSNRKRKLYDNTTHVFSPIQILYLLNELILRNVIIEDKLMASEPALSAVFDFTADINPGSRIVSYSDDS